MAKIWDKGFDADKAVSDFTVGKDRELDLRLAKYDVIGSMAHIKMLAKIGLLTNEEEKVLHNELQRILDEIERGDFRLDDDVEDIHSQVEALLTEKLGETGKKNPFGTFAQRSGTGGHQTLSQGRNCCPEKRDTTAFRSAATTERTP